MAKLTKLRSALKKLNSFCGRLRRSSSAVSAVVYVGRTRREYRVDAELLSHPAMQKLLETPVEGSDEIIVGCEPVLFDHLRLMIENSDPRNELPRDLAHFYAY